MENTQTNSLRQLLKFSSIFMSDIRVRKRLSRLYVKELREHIVSRTKGIFESTTDKNSQKC